MSGTSSLGDSRSAAARGKASAEFESKPGELTISQMSRHFGVSLRTLRFYEDRGLITPRRKGAARFYRPSDKVRMEMILMGKKLGFSLTEMAELVGGGAPKSRPVREARLQRAAA
jgi:DNA-binding transcriptional MerR regulator